MSCKISFESTVNTADYILEYGSYISDINNYTGGYMTKEGINLYLPFGKSTIKYKDHDIHINYRKEGESVGTQSYALYYKTVEVECISKDIILEFIEEAKKHCVGKKEKSEIICYMMVNGVWRSNSKLPKRPLDTIYIDNEIKENLVQDIQSFLDNEDYYNNLGIPYKRNYMFYGPPGTGKTSSIFSLASHFDMNIGFSNFTKQLNDISFMTGLSNIPTNTILVLEDIDRLFTNNELEKTSVTFSGLLNTLDGISRKHKLITIMTANHIKKIENVVIRPGRIDCKQFFGYMSYDNILMMVKKFIPNEDLHTEFVEKIRKLRIKNITPACIQQYLLCNVNNDNLTDNINDLRTLVEDQNSNNNNMYI